MQNNAFVYLVIAVVIAHFIFAVGYLIYKIMKAPKRSNESTEQEEQNDSF